MSYCVNCGFQLNESAKFCPQCGTPIRPHNTGAVIDSNTSTTSSDSRQNQKERDFRAMVCELCGSNDIIKRNGLFECQHCGTKYTVEEAKGLIGVVKIDYSNELRNLYEIARRARNDNNSESAQKYYEQILVKDPSSWEAYFYSVYFQSMNTNIAGIQGAANRITACEKTTLDLIAKRVTDPDSQTAAISEVVSRCIMISELFFNVSRNHFNSIDETIRGNYHHELVERGLASRDIVYGCGNYVEQLFGEEFAKTLSVQCWKTGVKMHRALVYNVPHKYRRAYSKEVLDYVKKIQRFEPKYK